MTVPRGTLGGQGRRSASLGGTDPRDRRSASAQAQNAALAKSPIEVDSSGRLSLNLAALAALLASSPSAAASISAASTAPGSTMVWPGYISKIPSGWLLCDGSAISRSTYADLFDAIGTLWGVGDGATTFNVPDYRSRYIKGWAAGVDPGSTGGALTHSHTAGTYVNSSVSAGTPAGAVSTPTISWPAGVPTAANESAHTHSVTSSVSVDDHASHTHSVTSNVAVGNHTFTQPTITGSVAAEAAHTHAITQSAFTSNKFTLNAGGSTAYTGGGVVTTPSAAGSSHTHTVGTLANSLGAVDAHAVTNNAVTSGGPSATLTHTTNNPAVTSAAGSAHTHAISWPAGVPLNTAPAFTGSALGTHTHTITGSSDTVNHEPPYGQSVIIIKT